MHPSPPRLETSRLVLRLPEPADARAILDYYRRNREHLEPWEPERPAGFLTLPYWDEQIRRAHRDFRNDLGVRLFLFHRGDPARMAGYIGFSGITRGVACFCHMGYSLDAAAQGQGLMAEAVEAAVGYMFGEFRMHRVMANYMPWNRRSARLLERCGFAVEGYARDYLRIAGRWQDHVLAARLNPHWRDA